MNKQRRKQIDKIIESLHELDIEIEGLFNEESCAMENLPEGLRDGNKGECMEEACSALEAAQESVSEAISELETASL